MVEPLSARVMMRAPDEGVAAAVGLAALMSRTKESVPMPPPWTWIVTTWRPGARPRRWKDRTSFRGQLPISTCQSAGAIATWIEEGWKPPSGEVVPRGCGKWTRTLISPVSADTAVSWPGLITACWGLGPITSIVTGPIAGVRVPRPAGVGTGEGGAAAAGVGMGGDGGDAAGVGGAARSEERR